MADMTNPHHGATELSTPKKAKKYKIIVIILKNNVLLVLPIIIKCVTL